ncbi:heparinase II/III domain-containing protein [Thiorhodospira sibirica]|uniref:heparinase II/III domain-containing protein n=1 Tax=Thiorhodospira sibirica TaxID=154347 RepID=UPI00022C2E06|nr:heparinase II/III family protein [Thiorhodospira sibirica]
MYEKNVLSYAHSCFEKIIKNQFDKKYVHKEHSPHYHHLVLKSLKGYRKTGLYDSLNVLDEYIEGAEKVAQNLYLPDGREIPFGDTDNQEPPGPVSSACSCEKSLWRESGYTVYKKLESYSCRTNSYNSNVHKHWDNLSVIWGEKGFDILVDPGKYKNSNDDLRKRVLSSLSHNTLNFDNWGWSSKNIVRGSIFSEAHIENDRLKVMAELGLKCGSDFFKFSRNLQYQTGKLAVIDSCIGCDDRSVVYSIFNFHKEFYVALESPKSLVLSNGMIDVVMSFPF